IHRDFHPGQVLVDGEGLVLIDFDLYAHGDPGLDVGNFAGHLIELALRKTGDPTALDDRVEAMVQRFIECSGEQVRFSVAAYTLLTLVRHIYLSTQYPDRNHTTERLLELCERRLENGGSQWT
ncbi:MAG: phosphotransferase family protein, partial [Pirellulales bacterium]